MQTRKTYENADVKHNAGLKQRLLEQKRKAMHGDYNSLILEEEYIYPPIQHSLQQILISQYAIALSEEVVQNANSEPIQKKIKYPLPIIFAYSHVYSQKGHYQANANIFLNNLERKGVDNYHIILYNLSKLAHLNQNHKKSMFYLETLLLEKPFFIFALYDLCKALIDIFQRSSEALNILERQLKGSLQENYLIQSLYVYLLSKERLENEVCLKKISKLLHNKNMSISSYYNLALFFKKKSEYEKSINMFLQIVENIENNSIISQQIVNKKDYKILIFSKINIIEIYQIFQSQNQEEMIKIYRKKCLKESKSIHNIFQKQKLTNQTRIYVELINELEQKMQEEQGVCLCLDGKNGKMLDGMNGKNGKMLDGMNDEKQNNVNKIRMKQKSLFNKNEEKIQIFNMEYQQQRQYNNKKLKYLLMKEKEINTFFQNLTIQKPIHAGQIQIKLRSIPFLNHQNQLIAKAKIDLKQSEMLQFQKQFEQKRKKLDFKYDNSEIENTLIQILKNLSQCKPTMPITKQDKIVKQQNVEMNKKVDCVALNEMKNEEQSAKTLNNKLNLEMEPNFQGEAEINHHFQTMETIQTIKSSQSFRQDNHKLIEANNKTENNNGSNTLEQNAINAGKSDRKSMNRNNSNFRIKQSKAKNSKLNSSCNTIRTKDNARIQLNTLIKQTADNHNIDKNVKKSIASSNKTSQQLNKQSQLSNQHQKSHEYISNMTGSTFKLTGFHRSSFGFHNQKSNKSNPTIGIQNNKNNSRFMTKFEKQKIFEKNSTLSFKNNQNQIQFYENQKSLILNEFQKSLKKAQLCQISENYKEAFDAYTNMYKIFKLPEEKEQLLLRIANLFEKDKKFEQAQKTYVKCSKLKNAKAFLKLGQLLLRIGRIKSGVQNLQKANCIKRYDFSIENKLVYGYSLREETIQKGLSLAHAILKKQPESLETLIMTANILEKQGKLKEAIQLATAIDKYKETEFIKHYIGLLYLQDSNVTQAYHFFKAALIIQPNHVPSLIEIATILSDVKSQEAIIILKKVLEIQPDNRLALARLGKIYEAVQNDFQNAMKTYRVALETQQNYESYMKIADCHAKKQSYLEALVNYKEALNLKKTHEVHHKIAKMYERKKDLQKAIENYQTALALLPAEHAYFQIKLNYLSDLGKASIQMGNYDGAILAIQEILESEESIELLKMLAQSYFGKSDYTTALEYFQKANDLANQTDVNILESIAVCFDKKQEYLASKAIYQKILQLQPDNIRAMNNLSNILLIIGETNQSLYMFENMLLKIPQNLEKRLKVSDIYATVGDWSKVEYHLMICYRQKQNDIRVIERLTNLYKEKRQNKLMNKFEKKLAMLKANVKGQIKLNHS